MKYNRKQLIDQVEKGRHAEELLKEMDTPMIIASKGAIFMKGYTYIRANNKSVTYKEAITGRKIRVYGEYTDDRTNAHITTK